MKKARTIFLTALFIFNILQVPAQQPFKRCATVEYNRQKEQSNPALAEKRQHANKIIKRYLDENSSRSTRSVVTIPVVVHVLYNLNIQNISDAQILSQIDVLNRDFGRLNTDTMLTPASFGSVAVNTEIQFCLASQDPNGNPTTGIERRQNTGMVTWSNNDEMKAYVAGGLDAWDRDRYLNIWVCTLANNFLGYTQLPGGDSLYDGVVITSRAFGDTQYVSPPFHLGRTATHEVGHWLGLNHIWGDDGGICPWDLGGNDDLVNDTPPQGAETVGCPVFPVVDNCADLNPGTMFMNYMDYTDDACMNMFTQGQADRMHAVLNTLRVEILSSDGCGPVGINEVVKETTVTVYPNPAVNELYVSSDMLNEECVVEVYDMLGQHLLQPQTINHKPQTSIDVSSLDAGTYFLKITTPRSVRVARFTIAR